MIQYKTLTQEELNRALFAHFTRHQTVTKCLRKEDGNWMEKDAPFVDDWSEHDYEVLIDCLRHTIRTGGFVYVAFCDGQLKGFVSVEPDFLAACIGIWIFQVFMSPRKCAGKESERSCLMPQKNGPKKKVPKSCIYRHIPRWKARRFIKKWDVWRRNSIMQNMWKKNRLTVSWSVIYKFTISYVIFYKKKTI
ncbi:hypothetical protein C823_001567 [Eubacterium plexicaudatum ASF492]|nr:hypothetical protein C823_001567 [Eubacterium plexicaudatum ASF492]